MFTLRRWGRAAALVLAAVLVVLTPGAAAAEPTTDTEGLLAPFNFTDAYGVPLDHYDITADTGGMSDWDLKLQLWLTNGLMSLNRLTIGACAWLLNWAYEFQLAQLITDPMREIGETYQSAVIDRLGLPGVLLFLGAAWCGVQMMRGRVAMGAGELAVTLIISALAATVLARPADLLLGEDGMLMHTRDTAMALTSVTLTYGESSSTDPEQAAEPLTNALVDVLIVQPHQALNYGTTIDEDHACWDAYREIVETGPWGDEDDPRERMNEAECEALADYNADPTADRLFGALLLLGATVIVSLLILLLVCALLIAVLAMGLYVVLCPLALVAALLPGGGRQLLWRWVGGVVKSLLSILAVCLFIAIFTLLISAFMSAGENMPLVARFAILDIVAIGGLIYHRKLLNAGSRASQRLSRRLETARFGGARGRGWLGPGGPAPTLSGMARDARSEVQRVTTPITRTAAMAGKAWKGKPGKPTPPSAGKLQQRMNQTRGGRIAWRAGKAAAMVGKVALGSTVGAPIALPKAAQTVKAVAKTRSAATKAKLASKAVTASRAGLDLAHAWKQTPPARAVQATVSSSVRAVRSSLAADADATRTRNHVQQRHNETLKYDVGNTQQVRKHESATTATPDASPREDDFAGAPHGELVPLDEPSTRLHGQVRAHMRRRGNTRRNRE
ncbi:type IV secretion system protein [Nocardiopsis metallicus]|uniref:Putative membrane protein n=1 Tax=Nocardiopsis metallicus TaxID=179819 RepID=A0A840WET1_9ACTN|nr:type IV secretion system protein [Nocardiopsis metallicus]MBB5494732.1 putative membrane protein [Nocardiopsis metallicus]